MSHHEGFVFMCEYAKSNRAVCKSCNEVIAKDVLQFAITSQHLYGKIPHWYHFQCFWRKAKVQSEADIQGFDEISWEDQEKIRECLTKSTSDETPRNKGKVDGFKIGYSKNGRSKCQTCGHKIAKNKIRIAPRDRDVWHDLECFAAKMENLGFGFNPTNILGFDNLKDEDKILVQDKLKPVIKKRKNESGDAGPSRKMSKNDSGELIRKDALKEQNEKLWSITNNLKEYVHRNDMKKLLEGNEQEIPLGYQKLREHLSDCMLFGALGKCPECGGNGQLVYSTTLNTYKCTGAGARSACEYNTQSPMRKPFTIDKLLFKENQYLSQFKFEPGLKRIFAPKMTDRAAELINESQSSQSIRKLAKSKGSALPVVSNPKLQSTNVKGCAAVASSCLLPEVDNEVLSTRLKLDSPPLETKSKRFQKELKANRKTPSSKRVQFSQPEATSTGNVECGKRLSSVPPSYHFLSPKRKSKSRSTSKSVSVSSGRTGEQEPDSSFYVSSPPSSDTDDDNFDEAVTEKGDSLLSEMRGRVIVDCSCLRILFRRCSVCHCLLEDDIVKVREDGTSITVMYRCNQKNQRGFQCKGRQKWNSQAGMESITVKQSEDGPRKVVKTIRNGNLDLCAAIPTCGTTYTSILKLFTALQIKIPHQTTFSRYVREYIAPTVSKLYGHEIDNIQREITESGQPLEIAMDARFSSPGFCADKCTVNTIHTRLNKVILSKSLSITDPIAPNSPAMENILVQQSLDHLMELHPNKVAILCTDGNKSIASMMKRDQKYAAIKHCLDVWHVKKLLDRKIADLSKRVKFSHLREWLPRISRHLYYSCYMAALNGGDAEYAVQCMQSLVYHIQGLHEFSHDPRFTLYTHCNHEDLDESDRAYIPAGAPSIGALEDVLFDKGFAQSIGKCAEFTFSSNIESFHNVQRMFCEKRLRFELRRPATSIKKLKERVSYKYVDKVIQCVHEEWQDKNDDPTFCMRQQKSSVPREKYRKGETLTVEMLEINKNIREQREAEFASNVQIVMQRQKKDYEERLRRITPMATVSESDSDDDNLLAIYRDSDSDEL